MHAEFGSLRVQVVQFIDFFTEDLVNLHRPFLRGGLTEQLVLLGRLVAHLCLYVLDLLLKEVVLLLLVEVLTRLVADIRLQVQQVDLAVYDLHHVEKALFHRLHLQQLDLLLHAERQVRADKVQGHDVVRDVLDSERGLIGDLVRHAYVLVHLTAQVFDSRLKLAVALIGLDIRQLLHVSHEEGRDFGNLLQVQSAKTLHDNRHVAIGQCHQFQNLRIYTCFVEVFLHGHFYVRVVLTHDTDDSFVLIGSLHQDLARVAADEDRGDHTWK